MDTRTALETLLDQVDYTNGACAPTEMVGAVLPKEVITLAKRTIQENLGADVELAFLNNTLNFHPRAKNLMVKRKFFIVIARDEPYFLRAYNLIRKHEMSKGTWTEEDERVYQEVIS